MSEHGSNGEPPDPQNEQHCQVTSLPRSNHIRGTGDFGQIAEVRLIGRALRNGWNVPPEVKAAIVARAASIARGQTGGSTRDQLHACKVLAQVDAIDAQRERTAAGERQADQSHGLQLLREGLRDPAVAAILAQLAGQLPASSAAQPAQISQAGDLPATKSPT